MKIIRIKEVMNKTSIGRTKLYEMMDEGAFPRSVKLGARSVGWVDTEVYAWIKDLVLERDGSVHVFSVN